VARDPAWRSVVDSDMRRPHVAVLDIPEDTALPRRAAGRRPAACAASGIRIRASSTADRSGTTRGRS